MHPNVGNNKCPGRDTISSVIISATRQMMSETGKSVSGFATDRLVPALEIQSLINIGTEGLDVEEYSRWRSRSIKRIQRIMDGETPMPADWVFTWMSVLSEPYKSKCRQKVAAMQGLMWVQLPTYSSTRPHSVEAEIDVITAKFGDVLTHAEPAHDGFYDNNDDRNALKNLQNRLLELFSHIKREMFNIQSATGIAPDHVELSNISPLTVDEGTVDVAA